MPFIPSVVMIYGVVDEALQVGLESCTKGIEEIPQLMDVRALQRMSLRILLPLPRIFFARTNYMPNRNWFPGFPRHIFGHFSFFSSVTYSR